MIWKTKITEMLGIKYPIIQAGMGYVADVNLAAAVSNAGGLGILASTTYTEDTLRKEIKKLKELTDKPFAINVFAGDPREKELGLVALEEEVPVIGYGRSDPGWLMEAAKQHKCIKMPTVGSLNHALRAEQDGADILVVQGSEGGGHTGHISSLVLIPEVVKRVKVPVVAAGGFGDGIGLVAALAMGAQGIYMGTRFAATKESPFMDHVKERFIKARAEEARATDQVTGHNCRMLNNKLYIRASKGHLIFRPWELFANIFRTSKEMKVATWNMIGTGLRQMRSEHLTLWQLLLEAQTVPLALRSTKYGDLVNGLIPVGQIVGSIDDIPTCEELINRIIGEAEDIIRRLPDTINESINV